MGILKEAMDEAPKTTVLVLGGLTLILAGTVVMLLSGPDPMSVPARVLAVVGAGLFIVSMIVARFESK